MCCEDCQKRAWEIQWVAFPPMVEGEYVLDPWRDDYEDEFCRYYHILFGDKK